MGRAKAQRKARKVRLLQATDARVISEVKVAKAAKKEKKDAAAAKDGVIEKVQDSAALFFSFNAQLTPPYRILLDTNFINFSIQNKLDLFKGLMDLLYAKVIPVVTDCVVGELEKMGHRFRLALRIAKDPRIVRLTCTHQGTYADNCLVDRVTQHRCYIVGTNDKDLQKRIRKIAGVPIVTVVQHKYAIERLPDAQLR